MNPLSVVSRVLLRGAVCNAAPLCDALHRSI